MRHNDGNSFFSRQLHLTEEHGSTVTVMRTYLKMWHGVLFVLIIPFKILNIQFGMTIVRLTQDPRYTRAIIAHMDKIAVMCYNDDSPGNQYQWITVYSSDEIS